MATHKSQGNRLFMVISLLAMLAALIVVGMQMRKPGATPTTPAGTTTQHGAAPANPTPPPNDGANQRPNNAGNMNG